MGEQSLLSTSRSRHAICRSRHPPQIRKPLARRGFLVLGALGRIDSDRLWPAFPPPGLRRSSSIARAIDRTSDSSVRRTSVTLNDVERQVGQHVCNLIHWHWKRRRSYRISFDVRQQEAADLVFQFR